MTTSSASFAGPVGSSQAFLTPAFMAPRSQQSLTDYPPRAAFSTEQQMQTPVSAAGMYPSQQSPVGRSMNLSVNPKLPSLEGLLKQMQSGSTSPQRDGSEPQQQQQRLSPVTRDHLAPMPSLRTMMSPNLAKRVLPMSSLSGAAERSPVSLPSMSSYGTSMSSAYSAVGPAFPSKKRSWADATPVQPAMFPSKARTTPTSHGSGTHRSRASKYCKIEGCERVSQRNNLCHSHGGKRLCKEEGCSSKDRGNGYCIKHGGGKICSMTGCEKKARRKGLCTQHFRVSDENVASVENVAAPYLADRGVYRTL